MAELRVTIDGRAALVPEGTSILAAARGSGVSIPSLCVHPAFGAASAPKNPPRLSREQLRLASEPGTGNAEGCGLCVVEVDGVTARACTTEIRDGMVVETSSQALLFLRKHRLEALLQGHPHACLGCSESTTCPRTECSRGIPAEQRCCELLGSCELEEAARVIGLPGEHPDPVLCRNACPAGVDIPRMLRHIARGEPERAAAVVRERIPLAFAASYVCLHPCESTCKRGQLSEPLSVCRLQRFAMSAENHAWLPPPSPHPPSNKRVAIVGSGPAGLTAAYYLARKGHRVVVLEALAEAGGMLRVGIPEFRYPRELLERDLEVVKSAGVEIVCNASVDPARLLGLGREHDAVFVAAGAHAPVKTGLEGLEAEGVFQGVDFLRDRALGALKPDSLRERRVAVVGGGNLAIDSARVARRLGAHDVVIVSQEGPGELPASTWEIEEAGDEWIRFLPGYRPLRIEPRGGPVQRLVLERCAPISARPEAFPVESGEAGIKTLPADTVILALGHESSPELGGLWRSEDGVHTPGGPPAGLFAGGDFLTGPRSVIEAIASGRRAAEAIDRALGGDGDIQEEVSPSLSSRSPERASRFAALLRQSPRKRAVEERLGSFCLIEETLEEEVAVAEARRCLACDLRLQLRGETSSREPDEKREADGGDRETR